MYRPIVSSIILLWGIGRDGLTAPSDLWLGASRRSIIEADAWLVRRGQDVGHVYAIGECITHSD
jgi:hypothetical protein